MFRVFLLVLALGIASASTIATVNCDGSIVSDSTHAHCNKTTASVDTAADAQVDVGALNSFFTINVSAAGPGGESSAQGTVSGAYIFTVASGTGGGFFLPCIGGNGGLDVFPGPGAASTFASFGPLTNSGGGDICSSEGLTSALPFVDDAGQEFAIFISASASKSSSAWWAAGAGLGGPHGEFLFWDSRGNPLSNVSYTLTEVPEPGSFAVVLVAFLTLSIVRFPLVRGRHSCSSQEPDSAYDLPRTTLGSQEARRT